MANFEAIKPKPLAQDFVNIWLPMRTSVKILFGLSMPVLALAALWLWGLRQAQQQCEKNDEDSNHDLGPPCDDPMHDDDVNDPMHDDEEKTTSVETVIDNCDDSKSLKDEKEFPNPESISESVSSEKEDLSDKSSSDTPSPTESLFDEQKKEEGCDIETSDAEGDDKETWEVEFPQALCGRLIGKKGKNVQKISQITGTKIRLIPQKENGESSQRLVSLTGTPKQLSSALKALQGKFPSVPFKRLNGTLQCVSPSIESSCSAQTVTCVVLPQQEMFNAFVISIADANHFYVQLYDQMQTIQSVLQQLDQQMFQYYNTPSQGGTAAIIPHPVTTGMVCASLNHTGWWWRAQVVGLLMKPDEVEITWLDYGGKATVPTTMLRQLRQDFLQLPFQAVECYLSNVVPHQAESSFSMAACALLEELTKNVVLTARITSYNRECPYLELYAPQWTGQPIFINRELVRRGFARWSET